MNPHCGPLPCLHGWHLDGRDDRDLGGCSCPPPGDRAGAGAGCGIDAVIPVRALKNAGTEAFTAKQREVANKLDKGEVDMMEAQLEIEHYWAGALRRAVIDGDVENGSLMAGQSVGMVSEEESVADIIATLVQQADAALHARG